MPRARTVIEVVAVAIAAVLFAGAVNNLRARPRLVVGTRDWWTSWAVPAEPASVETSALFPDGRAHNQTVREVVELSLGGAAFRLRLTNRYGDLPLKISEVAVAPALANSGADTRNEHRLSFSGQPRTTIPPGDEVTSDPINAPVDGGQLLAVSIAVSGSSPLPTLHVYSGHTSGISAPNAGDVALDGSGAAYTIRTTSTLWLATVEVLNPAGAARVLVALGDSLTDAYMLGDTDLAWPELVRRQLAGTPSTAGVGVINSGLSGNTVTAVGCPSCGDPLVERVIRDAVNLPGVDTAVVLAGTNDIARGVPAATLVHGLASVAAILHAHGIKAIAMTIPPRVWKPPMESVRRAVNGWLRAQHDYDALVDLDPLISPGSHLAADGLHFTENGRLATASALASEMLTRWR